MRALSSFKSEVAAFRQQLDSDPDPVHVGNRWRYDFTTEVLDRLERHLPEKTWNKIKPSLRVAPGFFIGVILRNALLAEGLTRIREQAPLIEGKMRNRTERFLNGEVDEQLGDAIGALGEFRNSRERVPLREKTAPRNRFMANMRNWFKEVCGKPFVNIVAELTNIVFDLQEAPEKGDPPMSPERIKVSGEAVRSAARNARDRATRAQNIG
jgi:hypothetical protein